jgi:anaerobic dimethyl sulfoxide reductase subunit B (iron-sulfur subunit)
MIYAFSFDASACSGCKACQEACKDKNGLRAGILWRKVIEVCGGGWQPRGNAWENSIFAYNLSLACNHCTHPKCAGVCPVDAYHVRPDGIVLLDETKCMGCGYCAWACPYGAPQYDQARGIMTKCDFCYDYIDVGLPPSCVAACPLRVLEYGDMQELEAGQASRNLWQLAASEHPFPLPDFSRTEPHLAVKLHSGMKAPLEKTVSNREEIWPPGSMEDNPGIPAGHELPLVAFTLLSQMAAGMAASSLLIIPLPRSALLTIGLLLAVGVFISFLHLGKKRNAWRALIHLRKSWLSRELLMAGLFAGSWAVMAGGRWMLNISPNPWPMAILGLGLIYSMSMVYRLRAVPAWNTWRTPAAFFLSAFTLGLLGIRLFISLPGEAYIVGIALLAELAMLMVPRPKIDGKPDRLRVVFLGLGILGAVFMSMLPHTFGNWIAILVFIFVLVEETIGRWQFYARRRPFPMRSN